MLKNLLLSNEPFYLLDTVGRIIAVIAAFVLASLPDPNHFIFVGFAIAMWSTVVAALPGFRMIVWPLSMMLVGWALLRDPNALKDFFLGEGPNTYGGVGAGWVYIAMIITACFSIPRIFSYNGHSPNLVFFIIGAVFGYNVVRNNNN